MAHVRQSRPDSGLGVQEKVLERFLGGVPSLLGSGSILHPYIDLDRPRGYVRMWGVGFERVR